MTSLVQRYYAPLHGLWECPFEFEIVSEEALREAPLGALDKLRLRMTVWTAKLLGPLTMRTSVDYETRGEAGVILHTTRVSKWGLTLLASEESFTVDPTNVGAFRMRGGLRMIPTYWDMRSFGEGQGTVDDTASRATYTFDWLGVTMRQATVATRDAVTLTQTTPFSHGVQRLVRVR